MTKSLILLLIVFLMFIVVLPTNGNNSWISEIKIIPLGMNLDADQKSIWINLPSDTQSIIQKWTESGFLETIITLPGNVLNFKFSKNQSYLGVQYKNGENAVYEYTNTEKWKELWRQKLDILPAYISNNGVMIAYMNGFDYSPCFVNITKNGQKNFQSLLADEIKLVEVNSEKNVIITIENIEGSLYCVVRDSSFKEKLNIQLTNGLLNMTEFFIDNLLVITTQKALTLSNNSISNTDIFLIDYQVGKIIKKLILKNWISRIHYNNLINEWVAFNENSNKIYYSIKFDQINSFKTKGRLFAVYRTVKGIITIENDNPNKYLIRFYRYGKLTDSILLKTNEKPKQFIKTEKGLYISTNKTLMFIIFDLKWI